MDRLVAYVSLALLSFFLGMEWQIYTNRLDEFNKSHLERGENKECGSPRSVSSI